MKKRNCIHQAFLEFFILLILATCAVLGHGYFRNVEVNTKACAAEITPFEVPQLAVPIFITVAHAGVKKEGMGYHCASGYTMDPKHPERVVAITPDLLAVFPFFSSIIINCPPCPLINGSWMVVDRSVGHSRAIEIYIPNPNEVTFGGAWKGYLITQNKQI